MTHVIIICEDIISLQGLKALVKSEEIVLHSCLNLNQLSIILSKQTNFDLILINISVSEIEDQKFKVLEELRIFYPKVKIGFIKNTNCKIKTYAIYKTLQPDYIFLKTELNIDSLQTILFKTDSYISKSVKYCIKMVNQETIFLDKINRKIFLYQKQGSKLTAIAKNLNLSLSTVQKRVSKFKNM